jgi:acyl-CoA reductase-like NAD-dependent aldehyde dehydrogenase
MLIDGTWVDDSEAGRMEHINPATGKPHIQHTNPGPAWRSEVMS